MHGARGISVAMLAVLCVAACSRSEQVATNLDTPKAKLATVAAETVRTETELAFDGIIEAVNQATVSAQTSGRVIELPFDVGDYVEKGALIVRLRDTEQRARAESATASLSDANARLHEAQLAYERAKDIFAKGLIAKAGYDKAEADLKSAQARVDAAKSAATESSEGLGYTAMRAPYSGIVVARHIKVGELAAVGKPLMTGLSLEELRALVDIPQEHIGPLRKHKRARIILPNGTSLTAAQLRLPPSADPNTQSFSVQVLLPKGDHGIFPGTLVKVAFTTGEREQLLVPAAAIVHRGEITGVYVQNAEGRLSFRYIRIGTPVADGRVPIVSGLTAGENVALDPVAAGSAYKNQGSISS
jgi:RND family efflux transporter MFP subunit